MFEIIDLNEFKIRMRVHIESEDQPGESYSRIDQ